MSMARPPDASSQTGFLEKADCPEIKSPKMQAFGSYIASKLLSLALSPSAKASLIGACVVVGGVLCSKIGACVVVGGVLCSNPITIAVTVVAGAIFGFYCYKNREGIKKELGTALSRRFSNRIDVQNLIDRIKNVEEAKNSSDPMIQAAYRILYLHENAASFEQSPKVYNGFDDPRRNHIYTKKEIEILSAFEKKVH